ncbi:MAG TPA: ribonuclease H-like domain-containing protein [Bacteroidota bacterium]|nr:ribonuclease H-like domain-containing protein [Bacteroidota bacterium]
MNKKNRILFDIETARIDEFDNLNETQKEYLLRGVKNEEEKEQSKKLINLYPYTAMVVCIAVINVDERNAGIFYYSNKQDKWIIENKNDSISIEGIEESLVDNWLKNLCIQKKLIKAEFYPFSNEENILEKFWQVIECYDQFITFNGRNFDCPFLHIRSAIKKIVPSVNLITPRFKGPEYHCDLLEELTYNGATRKFNLDFYCNSLGIESPKSHGISGYDMNKLFYDEKRYEDIAKYCLGDVVATTELFHFWDSYLNPQNFKSRKGS